MPFLNTYLPLHLQVLAWDGYSLCWALKTGERRIGIGKRCSFLFDEFTVFASQILLFVGWSTVFSEFISWAVKTVGKFVSCISVDSGY